MWLYRSQGGKEYLMRAHFGLPSVEAEDKEGKPPISVKFEIPYFTTSGIQVLFPSNLSFVTLFCVCEKQTVRTLISENACKL